MDKIYEQAKDLHVRKYIAYAKTSDHKLYKETAFTNQLAIADVTDAFKKGALLVSIGNKLFTPVAIDGTNVSIVIKTGSFSEAFDATETYAIGDTVVKDGVPYVCKTAIESAAAWNESKWTELKTADVVEFAAKA